MFHLLMVGDSYFRMIWHSSIIVIALRNLKSIRDLRYRKLSWYVILATPNSWFLCARSNYQDRSVTLHNKASSTLLVPNQFEGMHEFH